MQYESENPLSGVPQEFCPENLGEVSDKQEKDFTKTFWLWKSGTKAS